MKEQILAEFDKKFEGYWRGRAIPDEIKFFISKALEKVEKLTAAQEKTAWLNGERCEVCGNEKKQNPTWSTCEDCD